MYICPCVDSERLTSFFNKSRSSLLLFLLGVQVPKQNFNGGKMILAFKLELEVKVLKKNIGTPTSSFQFGQQKFQKLIVNSTSVLILEPKEIVELDFCFSVWSRSSINQLPRMVTMIEWYKSTRTMHACVQVDTLLHPNSYPPVHMHSRGRVIVVSQFGSLLI